MRLRGLVIDPPVALAPMAGLTHRPFRSIVSRAGGTGLFVSEMLSARALAAPTARDRYLLATGDDTRPFFFQIFASAPDEVEPALRRLADLLPDGIDLNLACPAPRVRKRGAGATLGADPARAAEVLAAARSGTPLPLTCKIRLPESAAGFERLLSVLDRAGADGVAVHARRPDDGRDRPARWSEVARARDCFGGAIVVNGGITSVPDAIRALREARADGVMIGRAALADPALGLRIAAALAGAPPPSPPSPAVQLGLLCEELRAFFPEAIALRSLRLHLHYAAPWIPFGHHLWRLTRRANTFDQAAAALRDFTWGDVVPL